GEGSAFPCLCPDCTCNSRHHPAGRCLADDRLVRPVVSRSLCCLSADRLRVEYVPVAGFYACLRQHGQSSVRRNDWRVMVSSVSDVAPSVVKSEKMKAQSLRRSP